MNDNQTKTSDLITKLDKNTMYRASIHFYSKGDGDATTTSLEVSHPLADDFADLLPSSYAAAREVLMTLRNRAVLYSPSDEDLEVISNDDIPQEVRAERILASAQAQEEAIDAVLH